MLRQIRRLQLAQHLTGGLTHVRVSIPQPLKDDVHVWPENDVDDQAASRET